MRRCLLIAIMFAGLTVALGCETAKRFVIRSAPPGAKVVVDNHLIRVLKDGYHEDAWQVHHADAPDLIFFLVRKPGR